MTNAKSGELVGMSDERLKRLDQGMQRYIDDGLMAGIVTLVARKGKVVHHKGFGYQDLAAKKEITVDTIFRIYSMTKPITAVALMMLYERGLFHLGDPVSKFIPWFKDTKVLGGDGQLLDLEHEITIRHLMLHTAGMIYQDEEKTPLDKLYGEADIFDPKITLDEMTRRVAGLPLKFQPGEAFSYGVSMDVIGYLIEVISDMPLDDFFTKEILQPLGMDDTGFVVPDGKTERFATLYGLTETESLGLIDDDIGGEYFDVKLFTGGSGLVSTTSDFLRFAQCLLNNGEQEGIRLLGRKTVEWMRANHLQLELLPISSGEDPMPGLGFGLGFSVMLDPTRADLMGSVGAYGWGGWSSTHFWIDPLEELIGILMVQYIPSGTYPISQDFRALVYQAIID
jgi:CubicO group peptidase (beta-lactamase class C family)